MNCTPFCRKLLSALLALTMILGCIGCAGNSGPATAPVEDTTEPITEPSTEPAPTAPADGNSDDVTCLGSHTVDQASFTDTADNVVATIKVTYTKQVEVPQADTEAEENADDKETEPTEPVYETVEVTEEYPLTNRLLQVFYWLEVAQYRKAGHEVSPDFTQSLDTQVCPLDDTVNSWQQYFLREALNTWASTQSMVVHAKYVPMPFEEAYKPDEKGHAKHFVDIPASSVYYGSQDYFTPNQMHQAYLDDMPALMTQLAEINGLPDGEALAQASAFVSLEDLVAAARLYNLGYMYMTELSYDMQVSADDVEAFFTENEESYAEKGITRSSGKTVNMRHILMLPENAVVAEDGSVTAEEEAWEKLYQDATKKLRSIKNTYPHNEGVFANAAVNTSVDTGSSMKGGLYENLTLGQLPAELEAWLFDDARVPGDSTVIRTACGMHIVYFSSGTELWYQAAQQDLIATLFKEKMDAIFSQYPAEIDYSAIRLATAADPVITADDLLYDDVAHERYPVAPLYMQQDYPGTSYGAYPIVTHGCGITTMSMLATYMTDTELSPPTMCKRYGRYCSLHGSDPTLFIYPPAEMDFYLKEQVFNSAPALKALQEGYIVVCLQKKGMWTNGGHFLLLEKLNENGTVQVRDSNLLNYSKLSGHKIDEFEWETIPPKAASYWIFYPKNITHPQCVRCAEAGAGHAPDVMFNSEYLCSKCQSAMQRRELYLNH